MNDETVEMDSPRMENMYYRYGNQYTSLLIHLIDQLKDIPKKSPPKSLSTELSYILGDFGEVNKRYAIWDAIENCYHVNILLLKLEGKHKELFETIDAIKKIINSLQIEVVNIYIFNKLTKDIPTFYN